MTNPTKSINVGDKFTNRQGLEAVVIKKIKRDRRYCYDMEFIESKYIKHNVSHTHLRQGRYKDVFFPSVCGVGYLGRETLSPKGTGRNPNRIYHLWRNMLYRCYSGTDVYYADCSVCDRWLSFANFEEDVKQLEGYNLWKSPANRYAFDKDLKIPGNREYSPETVHFIPMSENAKDGARYKNFRKLFD